MYDNNAFFQLARDNDSSGSSSDSYIVPPSPEQDVKKILFKRSKAASADNTQPGTSHGTREVNIHSIKVQRQPQYFEIDPDVIFPL